MVDRGGSSRWKHVRPEQIGTDWDALAQINWRDGLGADLDEQLVVGGGEHCSNAHDDESEDGDGDDGDDAKWTRKAAPLRRHRGKRDRRRDYALWGRRPR